MTPIFPQIILRMPMTLCCFGWRVALLPMTAYDYITLVRPHGKISRVSTRRCPVKIIWPYTKSLFERLRAHTTIGRPMALSKMWPAPGTAGGKCQCSTSSPSTQLDSVLILSWLNCHTPSTESYTMLHCVRSFHVIFSFSTWPCAWHVPKGSLSPF